MVYGSQRVQVNPIFKHSGSKSHTLNGFWNRRPQILGTWTLWIWYALGSRFGTGLLSEPFGGDSTVWGVGGSPSHPVTVPQRRLG